MRVNILWFVLAVELMCLFYLSGRSDQRYEMQSMQPQPRWKILQAKECPKLNSESIAIVVKGAKAGMPVGLNQPPPLPVGAVMMHGFCTNNGMVLVEIYACDSECGWSESYFAGVKVSGKVLLKNSKSPHIVINFQK